MHTQDELTPCIKYISAHDTQKRSHAELAAMNTQVEITHCNKYGDAHDTQKFNIVFNCPRIGRSICDKFATNKIASKL
jgi:hypothetical protein